jgi:lysozyme
MGQVCEAIDIASSLCKKWEGLSLKPYICPAGYPTIGYGSTFYLNGKSVTMQDPPITLETANELLSNNLVRFYQQTLALCPYLASESPQRMAAILDFVYNLGSSRLKISTLRKKINEGNWEEAKVELAKWVYSGPRRLPGLVKRRQDEINLI